MNLIINNDNSFYFSMGYPLGLTIIENYDVPDDISKYEVNLTLNGIELIPVPISQLAIELEAHVEEELFNKVAQSFGFRVPNAMDRALILSVSTNLLINTPANTMLVWRDAVSTWLLEQYDLVWSGARSMPTKDGIIAEIESAIPTPVKA